MNGHATSISYLNTTSTTISKGANNNRKNLKHNLKQLKQKLKNLKNNQQQRQKPKNKTQKPQTYFLYHYPITHRII
jgi:ABC-type transporter Mla subunit MlaD